MSDLYETWLAGLAAEEAMEADAGYPRGWELLTAGNIDEAIAAFKEADKYCTERGWRLPVQIAWEGEIKRQAMLERLRARAT
jgi:hypothetical protein